MYRYSVDNEVTYTPEDLLLFRESPFAVWMERLTLENPDHDFQHDPHYVSAPAALGPQDAIVSTLRCEGRNVAVIDWEQDEPDRRTATLETMRSGVDFIVNGQLAVGAFSGGIDLLMRTSGHSDLGDFLYIPCETGTSETLQAAFRMCFAADLLERLQGRLPPQLLIIRAGADVVPLQTDGHIHYYRAVRQRFLQAMGGFREHLMPDPAESSHFGRWAECASEVLRKRANAELESELDLELHPEPDEMEPDLELPFGRPFRDQLFEREPIEELPQLRVAGAAAAGSAPGHFDRVVTGYAEAAVSRIAVSANESAFTLAEQARMLSPGSFRSGTPPGYTPNLARIRPPPAMESPERRDPTASVQPPEPALQVLDEHFEAPEHTAWEDDDEYALRQASIPAPAPNLREVGSSNGQRFDGESAFAERGQPAPLLLTPEQILGTRDGGDRLSGGKAGSGADSGSSAGSVVDLDSAPLSAPVVQRAEAVFEKLVGRDPLFRDDRNGLNGDWDDGDAPIAPFSDSLRTSEEFDDR